LGIGGSDESDEFIGFSRHRADHDDEFPEPLAIFIRDTIGDVMNPLDSSDRSSTALLHDGSITCKMIHDGLPWKGVSISGQGRYILDHLGLQSRAVLLATAL
jgi:hypothetical protein